MDRRGHKRNQNIKS